MAKPAQSYDKIAFVASTHDEAEAARKTLAARVTAAVKEGHSYETPAVLVLPVSGGNQSFIDWILAETAEGAARK